MTISKAINHSRGSGAAEGGCDLGSLAGRLPSPEPFMESKDLYEGTISSSEVCETLPLKGAPLPSAYASIATISALRCMRDLLHESPAHLQAASTGSFRGAPGQGAGAPLQGQGAPNKQHC